MSNVLHVRAASGLNRGDLPVTTSVTCLLERPDVASLSNAMNNLPRLKKSSISSSVRPPVSGKKAQKTSALVAPHTVNTR